MSDVFNSSDNSQANYVEQLVGEGKKYASVEEAIKGLAFAQDHIKNLEQEQAALRDEYNKALTTAEVLERVRERQPPTPPVTPPAQVTPTPPVAETPDLDERIRDNIRKTREEETLKANITEVATRLVAIYGSEEKANEVVKAKAAELGVSVEFLQDVAAKSPKALFAQLGVSVDSLNTNIAPRSEINVGISPNRGAPKPGTMAAYEELRKTDPKMYWTPRIQTQLHKDALEKGSAFYG